MDDLSRNGSQKLFRRLNADVKFMKWIFLQHSTKLLLTIVKFMKWILLQHSTKLLLTIYQVNIPTVIDGVVGEQGFWFWVLSDSS